MKKKSHRSVPDFSTSRKAAPASAPPNAKPLVVRQGRPQPVKPQATSAKAGRRGQ
jgi:hypothetical protein